MRTNQSKDFYIKEKQGRQGVLFTDNRSMQSGPSYRHFSTPSMKELMFKLLTGLQKIWVALKFWFFRLTGVVPKEIKLPWFKIGLAALALFILTKKDVQFSLDMRAPLQGMMNDVREENNQHRTEEMGLVQPISLKNETNRFAKPASVDDLEIEQVKTYLKRFTKVAVTEREKYGIPASVKLAIAVMESWAGEHPATKENHNHFGAPLKGSAYENAWENWRTHSLLLRHEYPELFEHGDSYKKWAKSLKKLKYSKEKNYDKKIIEIIEKYQLYLLDE